MREVRNLKPNRIISPIQFLFYPHFRSFYLFNPKINSPIAQVVQQLPPPHFRTLEYLTRHLARVAENNASTGMTAKNVAIVWAPNLLRCKELEFGGVAALQVCDRENKQKKRQGWNPGRRASLTLFVHLVLNVLYAGSGRASGSDGMSGTVRRFDLQR
jgi:hypothetical protein